MRRLLLLIPFLALHVWGAAAVTHEATLGSTLNQQTYAAPATGTLTAGALLVVFCGFTGSLPTSSQVYVTDTVGYGFAQVTGVNNNGSATKNASADSLFAFVSQSPATAVTDTITCRTGANATGGVVFVAQVTGLGAWWGARAVVQVATASNQAAATPAVTFGNAVNTNDPVLTFVLNATNPGGLTAPATFTRAAAQDTGYATPPTGADYAFVSNGFTGTTVTWGSSSSAFGIIAIELDANSTNSNTTSNQYPNCSALIPCLIQSVGTSVTAVDCSGASGTCQSPKWTFPQSTGANNLLLLSFTYTNSSNSVSNVTDSGSNAWTGSCSSLGQNNYTSCLYYFCGNVGGISSVTLTWTSAIASDFGEGVLSEWAHVATSSCIDGSITSAVSIGPGQTVQAGSITTGATNDLVYSHAMSTSTSTLTNDNDAPWITPGMNAFMIAEDQHAGPMGAVFTIPATASSVNPAVSFCNTTETTNICNATTGVNTYNAISAAFKAGSGGTVPTGGLRIVHICSSNDSQTTTWHLGCPTSGNAFLVTTPSSQTQDHLTAVSDNLSNSYSAPAFTQTNNPPQFYVACNATPGNTNRLALTNAGTSEMFKFYDVAGAKAAATLACVDSGSFNTASNPNSGTQVNANDNVSNEPVVVTAAANELIIVSVAWGMGPPTGLTGPSGAIADLTHYTDETDGSILNLGNGWAHLLAATAGSYAFGWTTHNLQTSGSTCTPGSCSSVNGVGIAFIPAPSAAAPCTITLLGAGPC